MSTEKTTEVPLLSVKATEKSTARTEAPASIVLCTCETITRGHGAPNPACPMHAVQPQPRHPTVIQELVQMVPTWQTVSEASEWVEAREAAKRLSAANRDKTFRIYCVPHTYGGTDHWGKEYVARYDGGEQQYRNGHRYDPNTGETEYEL